MFVGTSPEEHPLLPIDEFQKHRGPRGFLCSGIYAPISSMSNTE